MVIEAGRTYAVFDESGAEVDRGVAEAVAGGRHGTAEFMVGCLAVYANGMLPYLPHWCVELVEDELPNAGDAIDVAAPPHPEETTEERHAADVADLGGNLPRLDPRRLDLRRLHALERVADALELLVGAVFEGVESLAGEPDEDEDEDEDEEMAQ